MERSSIPDFKLVRIFCLVLVALGSLMIISAFTAIIFISSHTKEIEKACMERCKPYAVLQCYSYVVCDSSNGIVAKKLEGE